MIIDSHVHITPPEIIENTAKYRQQDQYFDLLSGSKVNKFITADNLIKKMDQNNVDKSVVFGFAFKDPELCRYVNNYTIKMAAKYPERLIPFAVVNPTEAKVELELEKYKKAGFKGVGELFPTGQNFNLKSESDLKTLVNFCIKADWPLLIHINESLGHYYPGKTKDSIEEGAALAENFPKLTIIFAHFGGGLFFYELMPEMKEKLKNVYYDTAAQPFLFENNIYETIKTAGLLDKILFGSDFPLIAPQKYLDILAESELNAEEIEKITEKNFSALINKKMTRN